jgi:OOP family OmpA-OmpF porin
MHQPGKWWMGGIPLAIIWIVCAISTTGRIQRDVGSNALTALAGLGTDALEAPGAIASGRDVTITGQSFGVDRSILEAGVEEARGVRLAYLQTTLTSPAKPYLFALFRDGGEVVLSGNVPLPSTRVTLLAAAKSVAGSLPVVDKLTYATGAPSGFRAMAVFGIEQAAGLVDGRMSLSDNDFNISGQAVTSEIYAAALAAVQKPPSGYVLTKADILPPLKQPYVWSAEKSADGTTLSGDAPSVESRGASAAKAAALFAGTAVKNGLGIARGAPFGDFQAATALGLEALARLTSGKAILTDGQLTVTGEAPGMIGPDFGTELRAKLPHGFTLAGVDIKDLPVSPYLFRIEKGDGRVRLSGFVPDDEIRSSILATAKGVFFNDQVEDGLRSGSGNPVGFADAVTGAMSAMARLADGVLSLSGVTVDLTGRAVYGKAADEIRAALLAALPGNYRGQASVGVKPPGATLATAACQPVFAGLLAKGKILFETGGAGLQGSSRPILDYLIGAAQRCPQAEIEVAGHTDSDGAEDMNLELSERRAKAVVAYLAHAGIDVSRISARGYGQDKPIASNETPEGKAQNRRIEFTVK